MLSRRDLVGKLAAGTAAACAVSVARVGLAATRPAAKTPSGPARAQGLGVSAPPVPAVAAEGTAAPGLSGVGIGVVDAGPPATLSAPAPWELLRPLALGSLVTHGWRVAGLTGAVNGSCVLTLRNERGREHRVHVCRNAGRPNGLVYTKELDLVVMNGGRGDLPTEEGFAQAVAEVAHVLAANEGAARHASVVTALLPQAERVERFAAAATLR